MQKERAAWDRRFRLLQFALQKEFFTYSDIDDLLFEGGEYVYSEDLTRPHDTIRKDIGVLHDVLGVHINRVKGHAKRYQINIIEEQFMNVFIPPGLMEILAIVQLPQNRGMFPPEALNRLLTYVRVRLGSENPTFNDYLEQANSLAAWRDDDQIPAYVHALLWEAKRSQNLIEFDYRPAREDDDQTRHHLVEPYDIYIDDGHYYLSAFCRETTSYKGTFSLWKHFEYRIGRIVPESIILRSERYIHQRARKRYRVHYVLSRKLAKGGGSRSFDELERHQRAGGRLEIIATTTHRLKAVRKLLSYGAECHVLGGPEVLGDYRHEVKTMYTQHKSSA